MLHERKSIRTKYHISHPLREPARAPDLVYQVLHGRALREMRPVGPKHHLVLACAIHQTLESRRVKGKSSQVGENVGVAPHERTYFVGVFRGEAACPGMGKAEVDGGIGLHNHSQVTNVVLETRYAFGDFSMPLGRVSELIPGLLEAGLDCLQPVEVKAGMDLVELKKQYGDSLAFMGGIDVRCMADPDPTAIEQEIATKIPAAKKGGGYIYHSDHSVPDNVSFEQYQRTIELVHQYGTY